MTGSLGRLSRSLRREPAATTARLVLGQEAVPDKASETSAIPALIERLATNHGLEGALVSIDAVANLLRTAPERPRPDRSPLKRRPKPGAPPPRTSLKLRRKMASWDPQYAHQVVSGRINPDS